MATTKPRITVTLSDRQYAVLVEMAKLQKVSMSSIVGDLVETAVPVLERLTLILDNASKAPQAVLDEFKSSFEQAEAQTKGLQAMALGQLDLLVHTSGKVDARRQSATLSTGGAPRPPTSNRGVRIPPKKSSKPNIHAGSKAVSKGKKK